VKKALIAMILVLLILIPSVSAAEAKTKFGAGAMVGYPFNGAIGTFDITDKWDVQLGLGYGLGSFRYNYGYGYAGSAGYGFFAIDIASNYDVHTFDIDANNKLSITAGGEITLGIGGSYSGFSLIIMAVPGLSYTIPSLPLDLFLRIPLGANIFFIGNGGGTHVSFAGGGQLGAVWNF